MRIGLVMVAAVLGACDCGGEDRVAVDLGPGLDGEVPTLDGATDGEVPELDGAVPDGRTTECGDEICDNELDDDCDGLVAEDCACVPGEESPCYPGPLATRGVAPAATA